MVEWDKPACTGNLSQYILLQGLSNLVLEHPKYSNAWVVPVCKNLKIFYSETISQGTPIWGECGCILGQLKFSRMIFIGYTYIYSSHFKDHPVSLIIVSRSNSDVNNDLYLQDFMHCTVVWLGYCMNFIGVPVHLLNGQILPIQQLPQTSAQDYRTNICKSSSSKGHYKWVMF